MLPAIQVVDAQEAHLAIEVNYDISLWFYACEQLSSSVGSARAANALGRIDSAVGKDALHAAMIPLFMVDHASRSIEDRWREKNLFKDLGRSDLVDAASEVIKFSESASSSYCRTVWPAARANAEMSASAIRNAIESTDWQAVESWIARLVGVPVSRFPTVNLFLVPETGLVDRGGLSVDFRLPSGESAYVAIVDVGNKDILEVLEIVVHELLHLVDRAAENDRFDEIRRTLDGQSIFYGETMAHGLVVAISECAVRKYWSSAYLGRSHGGIAGFRRDDIAIWEAYVYGRAPFLDSGALQSGAEDSERSMARWSAREQWMFELARRLTPLFFLSGNAAAVGGQRYSEGSSGRFLAR